MLQEAIKNGVELETERWQARVDLAAAHRLCVMNGFHEGIFNHLTYPRARHQRPLLPDPVRPLLVRGDGELLHGSQL